MLCFLERYLLSYREVSDFKTTGKLDLDALNIDGTYGGRKNNKTVD